MLGVLEAAGGSWRQLEAAGGSWRPGCASLKMVVKYGEKHRKTIQHDCFIIEHTGCNKKNDETCWLMESCGQQKRTIVWNIMFRQSKLPTYHLGSFGGPPCYQTLQFSSWSSGCHASQWLRFTLIVRTLVQFIGPIQQNLLMVRSPSWIILVTLIFAGWIPNLQHSVAICVYIYIMCVCRCMHVYMYGKTYNIYIYIYILYRVGGIPGIDHQDPWWKRALSFNTSCRKTEKLRAKPSRT